MRLIKMPKKPPSALGVVEPEKEVSPELESNVVAFEKKVEFKDGDTGMEDIPSLWIVYTSGIFHKIMEYPALSEDEIKEIRQITEADITIRQIYVEDMVNINMANIDI